jgi:hypothetical protein
VRLEGKDRPHYSRDGELGGGVGWLFAWHIFGHSYSEVRAIASSSALAQSPILSSNRFHSPTIQIRPSFASGPDSLRAVSESARRKTQDVVSFGPVQLWPVV